MGDSRQLKSQDRTRRVLEARGGRAESLSRVKLISRIGTKRDWRGTKNDRLGRDGFKWYSRTTRLGHTKRRGGRGERRGGGGGERGRGEIKDKNKQMKRHTKFSSGAQNINVQGRITHK